MFIAHSAKSTQRKVIGINNLGKKEPLLSTMPDFGLISRGPAPSGMLRLRAAVLLSFCDSFADGCCRLPEASPREWRRLLKWLDTSGLALYFLARLEEMGWVQEIPAIVVKRLRENLKDNTLRWAELDQECMTIQRIFQQEGILYAVLKGISLWPWSVPRMELRSQLDLDFLVASENEREASEVLKGRGFVLKAHSGSTLEFYEAKCLASSIKDMYKPGLGRAVELHLAKTGDVDESLLSRREMHRRGGMWMPFLSVPDLFIGQGLHLYKHVCSEFVRAAHLLEFRRHVIERKDDASFWRRVESSASKRRDVCVRLGIAVLLIETVMGEFAPEALRQWTANRVPSEIQDWIRRYGHRIALASFPGSKLYLLLQKEMASYGIPSARSIGQALIPRRLPPSIVPKEGGEASAERVRRYLKQFKFLLFRLRFHAVEGARLGNEALRWHRQRNGIVL